MQKLKFAFLLVAVVFSLTANADRGGASGGGGGYQIATMYDDAGLPPTRRAKRIFIKCPNNALYSCGGECNDAILDGIDVNQSALDQICAVYMDVR